MQHVVSKCASHVREEVLQRRRVRCETRLEVICQTQPHAAHQPMTFLSTLKSQPAKRTHSLLAPPMVSVPTRCTVRTHMGASGHAWRTLLKVELKRCCHQCRRSSDKGAAVACPRWVSWRPQSARSHILRASQCQQERGSVRILDSPRMHHDHVQVATSLLYKGRKELLHAVFVQTRRSPIVLPVNCDLQCVSIIMMCALLSLRTATTNAHSSVSSMP